MSLSLRKYQLDDIMFLKSSKSSANFSEQRTGKSVVALRTYVELGIKRILLVCPASAILQWEAEIKKWTSYETHILAGTKKVSRFKKWKYGVGIVSYDALKKTASSKGLISHVLEEPPEAVILDEAHRIKDLKAKVTASVFKLKKVKYKMVLTGTPAPNKPYEIFAILHFLMPYKFSSRWDFIEKYFLKEKKRNGQGRMYYEIGRFRTGMDRQLQYELRLFSVQNKRKEVMKWLPNKDYLRIKLNPTTAQKEYLDSLQKYYKCGELYVQNTLDRLVRYRQICLAPELLGLAGKSPKLMWVTQYLKDYPEKQIIIFSKFTQFLKLLESKVEKMGIPYGMIIGETTMQKRNKNVKAFQAKVLKVLLINIDAGKEALTLDSAEVAIFTDKFPPVGDISQAEDRFVSTTKDKAEKAHLIIELVMTGTYDEVIYQALKNNKDATDIINDYKNYGGNS